jgi:hypothetical protein
MRKVFTIFLAIVIIVCSACSNKTFIPKALSKKEVAPQELSESGTYLLSKEGVAPYALSESDNYLLQSLGLESATNIISFKAPKTVKSLKVNVYVLNDTGTWNVLREGQVSLGQDANPEDRLEGTIAMIFKENYAIDFNINTRGRASYQTDTLDVDYEITQSSKGFLNEFQTIELNKEIPVAIMIYDSGYSMRTYSMEDFFSPSRFADMDIVQAVTLIFSDETN